MSNNLDLDQAQLFVRPDLGPICKHYQQTTLVGKEVIYHMASCCFKPADCFR